MPAPIRCIADLPDQTPQWLWPGRIPRGALTLLVGDPGRGKSLLTLDIAARVTASRPWPDGSAADEPGDVLLLSAEDSLARTVRARLTALGADLRRVHYLNAALDSQDHYDERTKNKDCILSPTSFGFVPARSFGALWRDADWLREAVLALPNCRLVVIDPIPAYLHDAGASYLEEARLHLTPLANLAERTGAAILAVAHCELPQRGRPTRRQHPLHALAAMARAIHVVERDPVDPQRRILVAAKNNLAACPPSLAFTVHDGPQGAAALAWAPEPVEGHPDDLLSGAACSSAPRRVSEIDRAIAWLQGALAAGPMLSGELNARAAAAGFSDVTIRRARGQLGVQTLRQKAALGGQWICILPGVEGSETDQGAQINNMSALSALSALPTIDEILAQASPPPPSKQPVPKATPQQRAG